MTLVERGMNSPIIRLSPLFGGVLQSLDQFYQPIQDYLLACWGLISLVGALVALSLVTLGCIFWLLDLKKIEGNQLVMAGLFIFFMLQFLMANLHWIFFLV